MKSTFLSFGLVAVVVSLLAGCAGGGSGVRITRTAQQEPSVKSTDILGPGVPYIVHVDDRERLATIRNGARLDPGFHIAVSREGEETAALKVLADPTGILRIADILEGEPSINDRIRPAPSDRARELGRVYREPDSDD